MLVWGVTVPELAEFRLADGSVVLVQVDGPETDDVAVRGWRDKAADAGERLTVTANRTLDGAIDAVVPAAETLVRRLRETAGGPDELTVEFGLQMSAQAGAYIAQATSTANFRVSMTWRRAT